MVTRNILISGADGFIGRFVVARMAGNHRVSAIYRRERPPVAPPHISWIGPIDFALDALDPAIASGIDLFIHLAAEDPAKGAATGQAARMADNLATFIEGSGVPKVLLMSSIAATIAEKQPHLARDYGRDRLAADRILQQSLAGKTQLLTLRKPAVYGPGMLGSLSTLAALVRKGMPIPLGAAKAKRHYISVLNLSDLVATIADADEDAWQAASGMTFEPSDNQPISTRDLIQAIGLVTGRRTKLFSVPDALLRGLGSLTGKSDLISGALDPVDVCSAAPIAQIFGWQPVEQMPESLDFLSSS